MLFSLLLILLPLLTTLALFPLLTTAANNGPWAPTVDEWGMETEFSPLDYQCGVVIDVYYLGKEYMCLKPPSSSQNYIHSHNHNNQGTANILFPRPKKLVPIAGVITSIRRILEDNLVAVIGLPDKVIVTMAFKIIIGLAAVDGELKCLQGVPRPVLDGECDTIFLRLFSHVIPALPNVAPSTFGLRFGDLLQRVIARHDIAAIRRHAQS